MIRNLIICAFLLLIQGCAYTTVSYRSTGSGDGAFDRVVIEAVDKVHDGVSQDAVMGEKHLDAKVSESNGRVRHRIQYRSTYRY